MRTIDADALSAFVGDLRSTLHKEQSTFKAMTQSEFEIKDNMYLNFQYAIDNAPTVEVTKPQSYVMGFCDGLKAQTYEKPPMFERPQGKWICKDNVDGQVFGYSCSNCRTPEWQITRFCPNCGADMRKGGAE